MTSGIYEIKNRTNGKRYIGSSASVKERWWNHLSTLRRHCHTNRHLQSAFDKYGEGAFLFSVLEEVGDVSELLSREQYYLDTLKPEYNILPMAGRPTGIKRNVSAETKRKISEALTGKHLSEETKRKISEALKGRHHTEETKRKIGEGNRGKRRSERTLERMRERRGELSPSFGRHHSEEAKKKMSEAHRGRKNPMYGMRGKRNPMYGRHHTAETCRKMSRWHKGKRLSEEHKRKIGEARRGKHHSAETKQKISESQKARRRKRKQGSAEPGVEPR